MLYSLLKNSRTLAAIILLQLALVGCTNFSFPGVYRIWVPQGNVFDEEMYDQLEIGMTRSQVRFVMGTPLIKDSFNKDRWDYSYQIRRGDELSVKKSMTLYFEGDALTRIEGDAANERAKEKADSVADS